jgi:hypothetical protein
MNDFDKEYLRYRMDRTILLVLIVLLLLFVTVVHIFYDGKISEEDMQHKDYCEMVELWDRSKGDLGWPPYRGRELCD